MSSLRPSTSSPRLLATVSGAFHILGGAVICVQSLLQALVRDHGYECLLLTPHPVARKTTLGLVPLVSYQDIEELARLTKGFRPDAVLGCLDASVDAARVARDLDLPSLVYVVGFESSPPGSAERRRWGIAETARFLPRPDAEFALGSADQVFSISRYMARRLQRHHSVSSEILYPEFSRSDLGLEAPETPPCAITAVCGYRNKGLEILLHLAEAFPSETFRLVGEMSRDIDLRYREALESQTNIDLPGRQAPTEFLQGSKLVLVPSQWPEPFGRIAVEAMVNGIPILASRTGGLAEIVGDTALGVRNFRVLRSWESAVARVVASKAILRSLGDLGRELAEPFFQGESARRLHECIVRLRARRGEASAAARLVAFHGADGRPSSYSLDNAQWRKGLEGGGYRTAILSPGSRSLPGVTIHHDYESDFMEFSAPDTGHCVAVRTWDFGPYPPAWVEKINGEFDQLWVYSEWTADLARDSGVDPKLIRVVPLGVDPDLLRPDGPRYDLPTTKSFRFLFVGGAVIRKGVDILLEAYQRAFTAADDVSLVIKDNSSDVFYAKNTLRKEIRELQERRGAPEVLHIDRFLDSRELAGLYRSCDIGVFPYRAEGFCKPILESMASGLPSIVPDLGPCTDFCDEQSSFLVPARRIRLPVRKSFVNNLGFEMVIAGVDFCQVPVEALARSMHLARSSSAELRQRMSRAGVLRSRERYLWEHSNARVLECVSEFEADHAVPRRLKRSRESAAREHNRFQRAQELYLAGREVGSSPRA